MEFVKYNHNPKQNKTNDCVIRAIAFALNKPWEDVYKDLSYLGFKKALMPNDSKVWQAYLKQLNYNKEKMPKKLDNKRFTLEEFADEIAHRNMTYIISIAKHLTVVKNKKLYDTWNCSHKCVGNYWIIYNSQEGIRYDY